MFFLEYFVNNSLYAPLLGTKVVTRGINSPKIVLLNLPIIVCSEVFFSRENIILMEQIFLTWRAAL